MTVKVLIFGASGFMIAHLLPLLRDKYRFDLTAYVRPGSTGKIFLREAGVKIIEGRWDDEDLINKTVGAFDLIWEAGDSHDDALPKILIPAMLEHAKNAALIRFTGTGNWITQSGGNADPTAKEYDDAKEEDIQSIHPQMFNGAGDIIVLDALQKGLNVWLLCTGGVYGPPPQGIQSAGVFVRLYTNNALQLGYAPVIGNGTAHMQLIHLDDVASATDILLKHMLPTIGRPAPSKVPAHERFWNAPGYSVEWKRIAHIWEKLFKDNLNLDVPVKHVTVEQSGFMSPLTNAEMKSKASQLGKRGWSPAGPSLEDTLEHLLVKGTTLPLP